MLHIATMTGCIPVCNGQRQGGYAARNIQTAALQAQKAVVRRSDASWKVTSLYGKWQEGTYIVSCIVGNLASIEVDSSTMDADSTSLQIE